MAIGVPAPASPPAIRYGGCRLASLLLFALLGLPLACASASPSEGSWRTAAYVARWTSDSLEVRTPRGSRLLRWPVGASCTASDPDAPAAPAMRPSSQRITTERADRAMRVTWRRRFGPPNGVAEQQESYRFLADRIELQVRVRWRGPAPRLARIVYGARLAPGCCDLEGLWQTARSSAPDAHWLTAPVPGVFQDTGDTYLRKRALIASRAGAQELLFGGIDEGDVCTVDGVEVGRTPGDSAAQSWTKVRRYSIPGDLLRTGGSHEVMVDVQNASGNGGIWRGPCVVGPRSQMAGTRGGDGWIRAEVEGTALYHWCPDSYRQPLKGRFTVSLTSADRTRDAVPENVTAGGRFMIPPYVTAIAGRYGWFGIGTLDLPRAEDGLRIEYRDGGIDCPFLLAAEHPGRSGEWTIAPRVAILFGGSRKGILDAYRRAIALPPQPSARPAWWSGPAYCTWGDQVYADDLGGKGAGDLTDSRLSTWLDALRGRGIDPPLVMLDAGWWNLSRKAIAGLHSAGKRVLLWTQPHWGPLGSPDIRAHEEWAVKDAAGRPVLYDAGNRILDYTSVGLRAHMARGFRAYVAANEWDADGIKLDFFYAAAPVWDVYADPSWGAGEQYRARVLRWIYHTIKQARPGALVTCSSANPLFGRVQDLCRLNDDWTGDPETYRRRAAIALALGEWVDSDDWNAYESYLPILAAERAVWGCETLLSALYRGDARNRPMALSHDWAARLSSILALARRAPVQGHERCEYDPDRGVLLRTAPDGRLRAAALPLSGRRLPLQALVVRDGACLHVASIAAGTLTIPTREIISSVTAVGHDGSRRAVPFPTRSGRSELAVEDAAGPTALYEIRLIKN